ncbi:MAG: dTDP-4-dehydrorhamnose reductase [Candidatus Zambryskibacteria bacterium]|nr:dTDP-4-dehydrorhamnose reductase [Candidatus Zambryskibacteria bacterium]
MDKTFSKTLITGAEGMVGSYVDFGIRTDADSLDITNIKEVSEKIENYKPDTVIHLAAETDVDKCERNPADAYFVNSVGMYNIALAAKSIGAKMVYISTAGVFDGTKKTPYSEEDEPNPFNYYGRSKYLGELIVRDLSVDYLIIRSGWMFGGGPEKDKKFVAKIIKQLSQPEVKAVNDKMGSPTFAKDLVEAIKKLLLENKTGLFHFSGKGCCSRYELALEIAKILRSKTKIIPVNSSCFNLDAERSKNEGLASKLDFMRPWQEALKEYLKTEWIQEDFNNLKKIRT